MLVLVSASEEAAKQLRASQVQFNRPAAQHSRTNILVSNTNPNTTAKAAQARCDRPKVSTQVSQHN